jgi:capsular polysaccharide transport system permease protein
MDDAHSRRRALNTGVAAPANDVDIDLGGVAAGRLGGRGTSPFKFQYRVLKALVLRDIAARHGDTRLGPLLSVIGPLIGIGLMLWVFNLRGKVAPDSLNFGVFMATGYPMWMAFRNMYATVMNAASRADPLLMFPQITQLDLILAKIIHVVALETIVFFVVCIGVIIFFQAKAPADPLGVMFCFWGCSWIGAALGMVLCALQRAAPFAVVVINGFMRLGVWVSGVIFTINRLPSFLWPYVKWNPLLHLIEGARTLWEPNFSAPIFNPGYVMICAAVLTTIGFVFERASRRLVGA